MCLLERSINRTNQPGKIWSAALEVDLKLWVFLQSKLWSHLDFHRRHELIIILVEVLDNKACTLDVRRNDLFQFQSKAYGELSSLTRWSMERSPAVASVHEHQSAQCVLSTYGLTNPRAARTTLDWRTNLNKKGDDEQQLFRKEPNANRSIVGSLAHLAPALALKFRFPFHVSLVTFMTQLTATSKSATTLFNIFCFRMFEGTLIFAFFPCFILAESPMLPR